MMRHKLITKVMLAAVLTLAFGGAQNVLAEEDYIQDIAYMDDDNEDHLLDIFGYEEDGEEKPLIIEVHGGGFFGGDKETNTDHSRDYENRGYAVVTPNYTHLPEGSFTNIVQEIFAVMYWAEDNAEEYHFDMNNVFMGGDSAGGFIVQLTAMVMSSEELQSYFDVENPGFALKSIVLSCPEYNILALRDEIDAGNGFKSFMAEQIADVINDDKQMAHVDLISNLQAEGYPPVYIITTPSDNLLYEDAVALDSFLTEKGIEHGYHVYEETENELGHVFNVKSVDLTESIQANDDCDAYLRSVME